MNFHSRFMALLNERGITAYRLAKETGISERLVGYWKEGGKTPSLENLIKLADYFGISIDYLVGRTNIPDVMTEYAPIPLIARSGTERWIKGSAELSEELRKIRESGKNREGDDEF